ncbi:MAG: terminase family protein [Rhodobacter sp.]|nr:terminase family protein [Rhodobacter sp.]
MDYNLSYPQSEFWLSKKKFVGYVSGVGGGKTFIACLRLLHTKFAYPNVPLMYGAPDYSLIGDIFYPEMEKILSTLPVKYKINYQKNRVVFSRFGHIKCKTLIDPEKLVGFEVGDAVLDEFDTMPTNKALKVWRKMISRIRFKFPDGKLNQLFVTTTPEGFRATYKLFKKEPNPKLHHLIQAKTLDNIENLPEDYIESLAASYPNELLQAYLNGIFINLTSGTVYYVYNRELHDTDETAKPGDALHIGCDFNVNKQAAIVFVYRGEWPYMVDEFIDLRDTPDMVVAIKERYPGYKVFMYPDATGSHRSSRSASVSDTDIAIIKDAGFIVKKKKSNPLIKDRVNSVNGLLMNAKGEVRLRVNSTKCPKMVESLEQQVYDKNGQPEKEGDLEHRNDGMGYFVWYQHPLKKRSQIVSRYNQ